MHVYTPHIWKKTTACTHHPVMMMCTNYNHYLTIYWLTAIYIITTPQLQYLNQEQARLNQMLSMNSQSLNLAGERKTMAPRLEPK